MSESTFQSLVDLHYTALYRFALSLTRQVPDACDLTQQTFFIWATKGDSLRDASKAKTWLFTTLYREFLRSRRASQRTEPLETEGAAAPDASHEDFVLSPSCDAGTVIDALGSLDPLYRAPLSLFYLEELSYLEIAEALEIPPGTVMSRLSRGKSQLRQVLSQTSRGQVIPFQRPAKRSSS